MKKQYSKPKALVVLAATSAAILAASGGENSATIGNEGENGTGEKKIDEITDGDNFILESKKNVWNEWED